MEIFILEGTLFWRITMSEDNKMYEIWKNIPGYEGVYQASNCGRIKSLARKADRKNDVQERILKPSVKKSGYCNVTLQVDKCKKTIGIHRLVLKAFIGEVDLQVNHINSNKSDNRLANLEYVTSRQNAEHRDNGDCGASFRRDKKSKPWQSHVYYKGKNLGLGCYDTKEEAIEARIEFLRSKGEEIYFFKVSS